ncbi:MAG: hypothetical protein M3Z04_17065 [Chloroflexota bacterium]|nr:hypothetical protein [Chloroflexota bacterium]
MLRGQYANGRSALRLVVATTGEPLATATRHLPGVDLAADEVVIKTYSENAGLLDALVAGGVVRPTGRTAATGFHSAPICRLLPGA